MSFAQNNFMYLIWGRVYCLIDERIERSHAIAQHLRSNITKPRFRVDTIHSGRNHYSRLSLAARV